MAEGDKKPAAKSVTKGELYNEIAEATGMKKADVKTFFESLSGIIAKHLGKKGGGMLTIPGLFRLKIKRTPASKGGQKKPNPFKPGEFIITKPKPASVKVKAFPVKALNESIK